MKFSRKIYVPLFRLKNCFKVYNPKLGISLYSFYKLKTYYKNEYKPTTLNFLGKPISFNSPFWFLHSLQEIFLDEVYKFEPSSDFLKIIDCGANIGLSAIYLKKIFPNSEIIAFEPDEDVFNQLRQNVENQDLLNVHLKNEAVWIENTVLNFSSEGSVGGKISTNQSSSQNLVKASRLKDYLKENNIFFLKMDIEGAEFEVLKDCREYLHNVENIFIEFHCKINEENTLASILKWIKEAGFKFYIKEAWNNMEHPFTRKHLDFFHIQLNIFCYK